MRAYNRPVQLWVAWEKVSNVYMGFFGVRDVFNQLKKFLVARPPDTPSGTCAGHFLRKQKAESNLKKR